MPSRAKGSTRQHAYRGPRLTAVAPADQSLVSFTAEDISSSPASGSGHEPVPRTSTLFGVVVEMPLRVAWDICSAIERWVRPEAVAVLLMSYLFIGLPLMVAHWL
ncbi:hypothetical protein B0T11DRAFT_323819 [Plectosphaerella cucumerina]|uniref:Uncharacterized protein n=1 Tax=Plectosphaerella cucumerina TaxID=40658 RepID=A0A8K0TPV4_9PEZI|nr:hypothetical protein B0T11DRAFT_323819 [Plectosphaerella cucumerina]